MKLVFLVFAILINFLNHSIIKSEEKVNSTINTFEKIDEKEAIAKDTTEIKKIHIVKMGETISSISKLYSISKKLIIKLNNLKDENYIYVGQNLIISESHGDFKKTDIINNYHIVKLGENLTEISNKYNLSKEYLIEINNLKKPDSIKVGEKLLLNKNNTIGLKNNQIIENKKNNELLKLDKKIYGPIIIKSESLKKIKGRKVLNVVNQKNEKMMISINCVKKELDVKFPRRKWKGGRPAKEKFEKNLINDFC